MRTTRSSLLTAPLRRVAGAAATALLVATAPGTATGADTEPVGEWPLRPQPEVVEGFDPPGSPYGPGHRGVDLLGSAGQAVRAALPGSVSFAAPIAGRGVVVVDHGETRTTYEPVAATVGVGDRVAAGDVIGRLALVGSHCFPRACLHWGWIRGETYLDPLRLVGAGPVRLLPLWRDQPAGATAPTSAARPWRPAASPYHALRPLASLL